MSNLKFIIFQCDTCKRQTEIKIDSKRVDPMRCNITLKCRGKMSRVGESSTKTFLFTPPVSGLQDYVPRGTMTASAPTVQEDPMISINSGPAILSAAILTRNITVPGNHSYSVLDLNGSPIIVDEQQDIKPLAQDVKILLNVFPISPIVLRSTTYTYLMSGIVQVISGPDDSPTSSNLRFTAENKINVLINGITLDPLAYIISVSTQSITLTPAIYESNNIVNVVVYNDIVDNVTTTSLINLEFNVIDPYIYIFNPQYPTVSSNIIFLESTAWGNFNATNIPSVGTRYLMHCTDLSKLIPDVSYGIKGIQVFSSLAPSITAGSFLTGKTYIITSLGNPLDVTNFILIGAPNNMIGTLFVASGVGSGTGTATELINVKLSEINLMIGKNPFSFQDKELNAYLSGNMFDASLSLTYGQDKSTGNYSLTVPQSKITQLLHSIIPIDEINSNNFSTLPNTIKISTSTSSIIKNKYIVGPV